MPLELIVGPANAGVSRVVRARAVRHVHSGGRALVLVPSGPDVSRVARTLSSEASVGLEIRGFDQHLSELWSGCGDGRRIVTPVQRLALLEESGSRLGVLGGGGRTSGLVRTMARVVQRAAEAERLRSAPSVEATVGLLVDWLVEYESLLRQASLVEQGEAHRIVAGDPCATLTAGLVAVEGFSGFTRPQEQYLATVSSCVETLVGLTYDRGVPATAAAGEAVERLGRIGVVTRLEPRSSADRPSELVGIERAFGAAAIDSLHAEGSVLLSEAWGEESEAARIVREIQDAIELGFRLGDIAVVYRDARHLPALRSALQEARLPAEYDLRVPFRTSGLGRALLLLLEVVSPAGTYDQLMDLLRSRYGPGSEASMDMLDAYARRSRVRDLSAVESWLRRHDRRCAAFLGQARSAARDADTVRSERRWYAVVNEMMRRAHLERTVAETDLVLDAAAARMFIEAVRSVNALGAGRPTTDALSAALREASIALVTADRPDHVQVLSAERVRGRRYRCVIVGGLSATEFPRRTGGDALSAASVAREFERLGIDVAPRTDLAAERLLFYLVVTRATDRLVLSWQSHDANGNPKQRSIFVDELLDLYRGPAGGGSDAHEPPLSMLGLEGAASHPAGPRTRRRHLRALVAGPDDSDAPLVVEARRRARRVPCATSEATRRVTADREVFSASEIEAFLQCPYRWFVGSVVAPQELDDRFDAASAGQLAHEILRRFYDVFVERTGLDRVTPEALGLARGVHAEVVASIADHEPAVTASEAARVRAVVRRTARIIEADATLLPGFVPAHREWSFGLRDGDEAERLASYSLRGRVDRIDVGAGQLVVTDYKLGGLDAGRGAQRFASGGLVQLPLYAEVASRRLGLAVGGGIYRSIQGGKPRGFISDALADAAFVRNDVLTGEGVQAVVADALERAEEAVGRMRSGDIHPEPLGGTCPPYCPAASFCNERRAGRG